MLPAARRGASRDGAAGPPGAVRRNWRLFSLGLGVRLVGVALIFAGDGSTLWWRKALVVAGVVLSVGGITVLRYMLLSKPLSKLSRRRRRR